MCPPFQHKDRTDLEWQKQTGGGLGSVSRLGLRKLGPGAARGTIPWARTTQWSPSQKRAWPSALCQPPSPPTRPRHLDCVASSRPEPRGVLGDLVTTRTAQRLLCTRRFPYVVNFLLGGFVLFSRSCARGLEGPGCPTALVAFFPGAEGLSSPCSAGHVVSRIAQEAPLAQTWKSVLQLRLPG